MPDFFAFAGLRYDCDAAGTDLEALAAPPYDVIDEERRAALEAAAPHNAVRLLLPRDERHDGDRYDRAADALAAWERSRRARDATRRRASTRTAWSSATRTASRATPAASSARSRCPKPGDTSLLPHERTVAEGEVRPARAAARDARERRPDLGPQPRRRPHRRCSSPTPCSRPASTPTACIHELGAIDDPRPHRRRSRALVGGAPVVLADGHHRFETACAYRDELRAAGRRRRRRRRDHDAGRRAGRRRARHRADPPPARPARRRRPRAAASPTRSTIVDVGAVRARRASTRSRRAWPPSTALGIVDGDGARARDRRRPTLAPPRSPTRTRPSPRPTPRSSRRW